jgi:hypothetical protein
LKPIWLVEGLVQPLTDACFLHFMHFCEQQIPQSSARSTVHVFPLGYTRPHEIRVHTFVQLEWGLLVSLYDIGT